MYSTIVNRWWWIRLLLKTYTMITHNLTSCSGVLFLFHIYSALLQPTGMTVLSFKPSPLKQQKIQYPISWWLQLSASVIPLLCTRLSELPLPLYERALGGKWAPVLSILTFPRGKTLPLCGEVSVVKPDLKACSELSVSGFDASLLYISISPSCIPFNDPCLSYSLHLHKVTLCHNPISFIGSVSISNLTYAE